MAEFDLENLEYHRKFYKDNDYIEDKDSLARIKNILMDSEPEIYQYEYHSSDDDTKQDKDQADD